MGAKTLGIVVNDVRTKGGQYGYGYGYGYGQGDGDGYHKPEVGYNRLSAVQAAEDGIAAPGAHVNGEANGK